MSSRGVRVRVVAHRPSKSIQPKTIPKIVPTVIDAPEIKSVAQAAWAKNHRSLIFRSEKKVIVGSIWFSSVPKQPGG